ncbi:MAG: TlpA family protein disulfide reductase [Planctomycetes bacterium]|nr:TlpA family protein disulfide reductase [Planctomycetota bacterium]
MIIAPKMNAPGRPSLIRAQIAAILLGLCTPTAYTIADDARKESSASLPATTLVTYLGDRLPGRWLATENLETIDWQVEGFVKPFQFEPKYLAAIQVHHTTQAPPPVGTYRCELANGDVLQGTPIAISDEEFVLDIPNTGHVRIERSRLRKLSPWRGDGQSVNTTPIVLKDWQGPHDAWREFAGRITAEEDGAELTTSLYLGSKSHLSIKLAWEGAPDFRIDFGSGYGPEEEKWNWGLRLETWQDQLVLVAEGSVDADLLLIKKLAHQADELTLSVYFDTSQQKILVTSENGKKIGEFAWESEWNSEFRVLARKKGLHFYSATVMPWDGLSPVPYDAAQPSVRYKDGKVANATVTSWNADSQEWTIAPAAESPEAATDAEAEDQTVSSDQIESLTFAGTVDHNLGSVQAVFRNGMRLSGELIKLSDHAVWLSGIGIKDPISIPLSNLQNLAFLQKTGAKIAKPNDSARLLIGDTSMSGRLISSPDDAKTSALVWKPDASKSASAIASNASGSIVYREPPRPIDKKVSTVHPQNNRGVVQGIVRLFAKPTPTKQPTTPTSASVNSLQGPTLHLRSGDSIPCQPKRIDSEGVTFSSPATDATFAPHEMIKALVLVDNYQPARVTKQQRDRLLTLPRIQQEYPPTHLLLSVDGDLLRSRLISMDDKSIVAEVRLNPLTVPRPKVAAIAWLHKDELPEENGNKEATSADQGPTFRVQAIQSDGIRLTLHPQKFEAGVLHGVSDVFGNCHVKVSQVDKLLFGQAIDEAIKHQSHQLLTLKPAIVPRFVTADASTPAEAGQDSALVDQMAPPIKLKRLDGTQFDLADQKGKVIVLDFWATWCGPCIQWMPQLEQIVSNYSDRDVELITINLLQDKEAIEPALERMKINPTTLLDIDGVVADAYQATAIPQTVIIDQQGKVVRLFIGGSPQLKQPLVEALDELMSSPATE